MDREEALATARVVIAGKSRSYVNAAEALARFVLDDHARRAALVAQLDEEVERGDIGADAAYAIRKLA